MEGVIGVVVLPLTVPPGKHDAEAAEPLKDQFDVGGARVVVDHVPTRHVDLVGHHHASIAAEDADLAAVGNHALDQRAPSHGKGFDGA